MVGGKVIEIVTLERKVWVSVRDVNHPKDTCAVYVERNKDSEAIEIGDSVWWQAGFAYWTPSANSAAECAHREHVTCERVGGVDYDIAIPRVSYSGVGYPEGHDVLDQDVLSVI